MKDFEVDPGSYIVEFTAMKIKGSQSKVRKEKVNIQAKQSIKVNHDFASANLLIGAKSEVGLVDAVISIIDKAAQKMYPVVALIPINRVILALIC